MPALDPVLLEVLACPSPDHAPLEVVGDPRDPAALRVHLLRHRLPGPRRHPA